MELGRRLWGHPLRHYSSQAAPQKELGYASGVPVLWTTAQGSLQITMPLGPARLPFPIPEDCAYLHSLKAAAF